MEGKTETVCYVQVDGETLNLIEELRYFVEVIDEGGKCGKEVENRVTQGRNVALWLGWRENEK